MEKEPGDEETDPDYETEKTDAVDRRQFAYPLFHQFLEVGNQADCKEAEKEEQTTEDISLTCR